MFSFSKLFSWFLAALMLTVLACGDGPEEEAASTPGPTAPPTVAAFPTISPTDAPTPIPVPESTPSTAPAIVAPSPNRVNGGTLVRLGSDPPTLDPHLNTDVTSAQYIVEIYGGLLTFDRDLALVGDIAEDWTVSSDGTEFTFRLNPQATFHDGRQVTAADFKWSMERASDPAIEAPSVDVFLGDILGFKNRLEGVATELSGVSAVDPHTLTLRIDAPKVFFLSKLTYPNTFVLDRANVEGIDAWFRQPNGTGPFRLLEYEPGEVLRLGRHEGYHLGAPYLDEVEFILSGGNRMLMYENHEVDIALVALSLLEGLRDPSNPLSSQLNTSLPRFDTSYYGMNVNEPPFDDPKVRQAFNYAVDRETLTNVLFEGVVAPAKGILPPGFPGYNPDLDGYRFDPEMAKRLLSESKYGDDPANFPPITLTLPGSFGASPSTSTVAVMTMWENTLGIRIDILQTEWAIYLEDLYSQRFQMYGGIGWVADYPDPHNFLDLLFRTGSSINHGHYSNAELDLLLDRAATEQDEAVRFQLYHEAEALVVVDSPWVPLWHSNESNYLVKPNVHDYFQHPLVIPTYRYVYFTE